MHGERNVHETLVQNMTKRDHLCKITLLDFIHSLFLNHNVSVNVETSSISGPNTVRFCHPTSHLKMKVEPTSKTMWFKNTWTTYNRIIFHIVSHHCQHHFQLHLIRNTLFSYCCRYLWRMEGGRTKCKSPNKLISILLTHNYFSSE